MTTVPFRIRGLALAIGVWTPADKRSLMLKAAGWTWTSTPTEVT